MSGFSTRSEFADYRAIASGVAIMPTVSVVIPAKNEARNLEHVFATVPEWVHEIVLVDGHSVDDTVAVARHLRPEVNVVHQEGRGKGDALQAGFKAAKGEIIVMMDADGSTDGREIPRFVAALVTGADFAKGSRFASGGGTDDITLSRRIGNKILSALVNILFGTRYTDLCYGYNAFWAKHLSKLDLDCDGFEVETVMNVRAAKADLLIQEIPSHEHSRLHGVSNLSIGRDGIRIAKFILREHFNRRVPGNVLAPEVDIQELQAVALAVPPEALCLDDFRCSVAVGNQRPATQCGQQSRDRGYAAAVISSLQESGNVTAKGRAMDLGRGGAMTDTDVGTNFGVDGQPRNTLLAHVKLVIWDLDDTFWSGTLSEGGVELIPANAAIVRELNRRGIVNSICSKNDFAAVENQLTAANGLWDEFVFPRIDWIPKGQAIAKLIEDMQLRASNVLFIDDNAGNLHEAEYFCDGLQTAGPEIIPGLLDFPQLKGKNDSKLSRLKQYRLLQAKLNDRRTWTSSNDDFLRSCDIRVVITDDLAADYNRVLELINRTNQLNYTKRRLTEDEFADLMIEPGRESGYIQVSDRYGDYGICGFYSVKDDVLTDFLFSCRILHMGVENWLYQHLGAPRITVVGEVVTALDPDTPVTWISADVIAESRVELESSVGVNSQARVLLKGGCDLVQVNDFLAGKLETELSYTNGHGCYVEWHHIEVMRRGTPDVLARFGSVIDRLPFISRAEYSTKLLDPDAGYTHVALSLLNEYGQGLYQLRDTDFVVPYGQYYVDITEPGNWSRLIRTGLSETFLEWFRQEFDFCGPVTVERFRDNVRWLSESMPAGRTLVLINGAEAAFHDSMDGLPRLDLHHRIYNEALDELRSELSNVRICDVRDFIRTADDVTFNIRHYSRKAHLSLAESLARQTHSSLRVVERRPFTMMAHKAIRLLRAPDLLARGVRVLRNLR